MTDVNLNSLRNQPDERGRFGMHGGRFVAETLMPLILQVESAYKAACTDDDFAKELLYYQTHYVGRPSPLYFAERLTAHYGGAKLYLKRDELNHTGAHKINNVLGQALLAKRMGKTKIIAETGAGQHGVATATACALFDMECEVFMGEEDVRRQKPNVDRMRLLSAKVHPVTSGTGTLKDAMNEALRYWVANAETHFYIIGTVAGPPGVTASTTVSSMRPVPADTLRAPVQLLGSLDPSRMRRQPFMWKVPAVIVALPPAE